MANSEHLGILDRGTDIWNKWREQNASIWPDLSDAILKGYSLKEIDFSRTNLNGADLQEADLKGADLSDASLIQTNLFLANLSDANLFQANLTGASLAQANCCRADLRMADLSCAQLIKTNLEQADIRDCSVFGISTWGLVTIGAKQSNLIITEKRRPTITVDNLEVAQFVYLLLNNEKIRDVIDTIGKKGVLILGRFTPERKSILDAIREELRWLGYVPIMFDFERPTERDFSETILTLTGMCRFAIVDITNPKSSPLELQVTVPNYMIPFVPIIQEGEEPFSMFRDLKGKFEWILDPLIYDSLTNLVGRLEKAVIKPALEKHSALMAKKAEGLRTRHIKDYI
jgi:uncharacterized protein YjbI with pentapeptide repeats